MPTKDSPRDQKYKNAKSLAKHPPRKKESNKIPAQKEQDMPTEESPRGHKYGNARSLTKHSPRKNESVTTNHAHKGVAQRPKVH